MTAPRAYSSTIINVPDVIVTGGDCSKSPHLFIQFPIMNKDEARGRSLQETHVKWSMTEDDALGMVDSLLSALADARDLRKDQ